MRIAIIGRTEILYNTSILLKSMGHEIGCILTAKEAPEYTVGTSEFESLAGKWNIPFAKGARVMEHLEMLEASKSDVAISINYPNVISQKAIDVFPLGILNAHGGDLPRYRGNACQAWAILNGENRIGLCIHRMVGGDLDSGDIIARDYLPIDQTTKISMVWDWMLNATPFLFSEAITRLVADPLYVLERQSENPKNALRCYPRLPEDGEIDWSCSSLEILRLINASNKPYAGAYCNYESKKMIIWDAEIIEDVENFLAVPGQVTSIHGANIDIACGIGKLRIKQIEIDGQVISPADLIKSIRKRLR